VAQIPHDTIKQVLAATDIVELISSYIEVKRGGSGFTALCPFHNEKSPSFNVTPAKQIFHCFGCGKGGDAIAFVREYENLPFTDAVRKLAGRAGIMIVEEQSNPEADQARRSRGRLLDVNREAAEFMHSQLMKSPDAQHARDYLKSRGFGAEMAQRWTIGWMPESQDVFLNWARTKKYNGRELVNAGLAAQRDENNPRSGLYVRFRDRLMFSIRNEIGDVVGFSGRQLREDKRSGKYVNSPETLLFRKSNILFALDRAKKPILKEKCALICEGQIDVIACHEAGIDHAIAGQGTAFTNQHARLLRRYTKAVILCYDGDSAGLEATQKAFRELAIEGLSVRVVELPGGDDPDTFLKAHGAEAFRDLLKNARDFFDFKLDRATRDGLLATANGRANIANDCATLLAVMTDHVTRDSQINHVATRLQSGSSTLREAVAKASKQTRLKSANRSEVAPTIGVTATVLDGTVRYLCHLSLVSPVAQNLLAEQFEALHESGEFLEGIPLLEVILGVRPDPADPAAVNAFLGTLPEADRLALTQDPMFAETAPEDAVSAVETSLSQLSARTLMKRDAKVKAALSEPGLNSARMIRLLQEAKEIQELLKGIGQRSVFEDQLAPSTRRPPAQRSVPFRRERKP
jgi:DNA primase